MNADCDPELPLPVRAEGLDPEVPMPFADTPGTPHFFAGADEL